MARKGSIGKKEVRDIDKRPIRYRKYPHLFLIVCEDQKTEPSYFERFIPEFPDETVFIKTVGTGRSSKGVVEQAEKEKRRLSAESRKDIDEVWTVFDKDDADIGFGNRERFLDAFKIAKENGFKVAYSNEAFELWLLLHFLEIPSEKPIPRSEIYSLLESRIRRYTGYNLFTYTHGKTDIIDIVFKIGNETKAIERATDLLIVFKGVLPIEANPSTTVHILVKRLRELIEYYNW